MNSVTKTGGIKELQNFFWCWLLKKVLLPIGDRLAGQEMMQRLAFLEKAQWWDTERLHIYRDRSLKTLLNIIYHEMPFYRELMDRAHVQPDDISTGADSRQGCGRFYRIRPRFSAQYQDTAGEVSRVSEKLIRRREAV